MIELSDLQQIAYKSERAASRRLAAAQGPERRAGAAPHARTQGRQGGLAAWSRPARADQGGCQPQRRARRRASRRGSARPAATRAPRAPGAPGSTARRGRTRAAAASARAWKGPDGELVEISQPAGYGNSSEAEYRALIALLEAAVAHGASRPDGLRRQPGRDRRRHRPRRSTPRRPGRLPRAARALLARLPACPALGAAPQEHSRRTRCRSARRLTLSVETDATELP
jgi:hypothetical protein